MAGCSNRGSGYSCLNPCGGNGMFGSDICLWYSGRPSWDAEGGVGNEWHGSDSCRRNLGDGGEWDDYRCGYRTKSNGLS